MNNSRLSPIISLLIVLLSSVIIDTHARYHHSEVLPRRHRHRHHSPSSSSLNSVTHRHNANSQHEGKKSPPLYEDTLAYEELYEDSDYPEDYESLEEDYNYEDYEVRPRRRRFRDHSRFANYRGSRLNRRRFFVRERNFEPDYYDEDYNYNHNHNHNHNRNRNFKVEELEIPRRHRKDFVKRRSSFGPRKGYAVRRQTGRKIPDYDSEEEFEFDREHKKKHNLTGNNNNVNFVHEKDKEVDKEEDNEEEDIWKEADEADDEEEEDDEEEKSFDDKDFMKMEDNNYFYKGAKREYRNIDVNGSRGVVRKEVRSVSSSEEFRKEKGFENSSFREKPMKIRVRDEDYDRRNLQSDNGLWRQRWDRGEELVLGCSQQDVLQVVNLGGDSREILLGLEIFGMVFVVWIVEF
ncbi:hypothetical protein KQX54_009253 [Cotesia glomerata]|uniref:Uncharacterized protein n=1 Tax=Cotesia glomerata TaxID=32391 RepID=A0AAV7IGJ3_COTGL|nr:hypothetical protein KQX54_009253 [Cotesia glomerata]